jgi:hypothetical protein
VRYSLDACFEGAHNQIAGDSTVSKRYTPADFEKANALAARLILADAERYGGPDALPVVWAVMIIGRQTVQSTGQTERQERGAA